MHTLFWPCLRHQLDNTRQMDNDFSGRINALTELVNHLDITSQ
jgi:hypothetical protein